MGIWGSMVTFESAPTQSGPSQRIVFSIFAVDGSESVWRRTYLNNTNATNVAGRKRDRATETSSYGLLYAVGSEPKAT